MKLIKKRSLSPMAAVGEAGSATAARKRGESAVRSQGYRLTPHIKRYYERARF